MCINKTELIKKRIILPLILMLIIIFFCSCTKKTAYKDVPAEDTEKVLSSPIKDNDGKILADENFDVENNTNTTESNNDSDNNSIITPDSPNFIVLSGCLLGSYENDNWNSIQNHENANNSNMVPNIDNVQSNRLANIDELLDKYYYVYDQNQLITKTNDFIGDDCKENYSDYSNIPLFNFRYYFRNNEEIIDDDILAMTSENVNPIPSSTIKSIEPQKKHIDSVKEILDEYELTTTNVTITDIIQIDIDNDNTAEDIIIAQTPRNEFGYNDLKAEDRLIEGKGVYSMVLVMDNDKTTPLFYEGYALSDLECDPNSDLLPFGIDSEITVFVLGFFDLNGDGKIEICLENMVWDIPEIRVYAYDETMNIKEVLYGDITW